MRDTANLFKTTSKVNHESGFLFRTLTVIYFALLLLIISGIKNDAFPQDVRLEHLESGISYDNSENADQNSDKIFLSDLEERHKAAMESGNETESSRIHSEMESHINRENISSPKPDTEVRFEKYSRSNTGADWNEGDKMIHAGQIKSLPSYHKQIDMKCGEDSVLYTAVNEKEPAGVYSGKVSFYRSSDNGNSWTTLGAIYTPLSVFITNISMLVESRSNFHKDSTRIILFYTKAASNNNDNNTLSYISFRVNGTSIFTGEIAASGSGREFSHISAVSDGAYYSNGTYFGVVCTESNTAYTSTQNFRILRTANWGSTWTISSFSTGFNDFYPSVDFRRGSQPQIYIAVERRQTSFPKSLILLRTSWSPGSSYTEQLISDANVERPSLSILKNNGPDTMMISAVINGQAVYFSTKNDGANWNAYNLSMGTANNFKFTHCYSSPNSAPPFTTVMSTSDGDSINIRRGIIGAMGELIYKINFNNSDPNISPVNVFCIGDDINLSSFVYGGTNAENVYFDQDGFKWLLIRTSIQGLYNQSMNILNRKDTLTVYLRNSVSPFEIADSVKGILDTALYFSRYFKNVNTSKSYYIVLKHRNSIETWSKPAVTFSSGSIFTYDFSYTPNSAFGNNIILSDNSPVTYSLYSGDVNQDGTIDLTDGSLIDNDAFNFASGYLQTDINGDDVTDLADAVFADNNSFNFVSKITP